MLSALVPFQMTRLTKSFIAHITFVRFLVCVNTRVPFQITRLTKTLLALIALVRFLVSVNTHVVLQMTRFTKTLLAHIALIRILVRVNAHVPLQITRLSKTLLANIALVRFLVRVNMHVLFQIIGITKTLLAHIALVLCSLPLHSFLFKSRFFFLYLMMICLEILRIIRNPQTQHQRFFFLCLQNRPRVHRALRVWIFPSAAHYPSFVMIVFTRAALSKYNINALRFFSRM